MVGSARVAPLRIAGAALILAAALLPSPAQSAPIIAGPTDPDQTAADDPEGPAPPEPDKASRAPSPPPAPVLPPAAEALAVGWTAFGSLRSRQEGWDWFGDQGEHRYTFNGSLLRFGARYDHPRHAGALEFSIPGLFNLPLHASLPPPQGDLGFGALYRGANGSQQVSGFLKQAFWRVKRLGSPASSLRAGRFEFNDGVETIPADPILAWLKRHRLSSRLIGDYEFSHVQRSLDGGHFVHNTPVWNVTAVGGLPTQGVFDLDGWPDLALVRHGYLAATRLLSGRRFRGDARLFGLYYNDAREDVTKVDNRPLPVREADQSPISIGTLGGHCVGVWERPRGTIDGLVWAAGQFGEWGEETQRSYAVALEAGYQPKGLAANPWFRAGYFRASGDDDPLDDVHSTFFPILPTPRIYARFPFYTMMNLSDLFVHAILRPGPRLTLRSDLHFLSLAAPNDLWYIGGGAFQSRPAFGYAGRPSGGDTGLATVVDLSVNYQWRKTTDVNAYLGQAAGGDVIRNIFAPAVGAFGYVEALQRW